MVTTFLWEDFQNLKAKLNVIISKMSNSKLGVNQTKYIQLSTLNNCLSVLKSGNFQDLSYRYVISDKDLNNLKRLVNN